MTTAKPRPTIAPGETRAYPVLALRDIVAFPHMIVPLFVGREKSIRALEEAMRGDTFILLATQKNASDDDPATDTIFAVGTLASVLQLLKRPARAQEAAPDVADVPRIHGRAQLSRLAVIDPMAQEDEDQERPQSRPGGSRQRPLRAGEGQGAHRRISRGPATHQQAYWTHPVPGRAARGWQK